MDLSTLEADLLLIGNIEADEQGKVRKSGFMSTAATLSTRLLRVESAEVVTGKTVEGTGNALGKRKSARRAATSGRGIVLLGSPEHGPGHFILPASASVR